MVTILRLANQAFKVFASSRKLSSESSGKIFAFYLRPGEDRVLAAKTGEDCVNCYGCFQAATLRLIR